MYAANEIGVEKTVSIHCFCCFCHYFMILQLHNTELSECTKAQSVFTVQTKAWAWQWKPCLFVLSALSIHTLKWQLRKHSSGNSVSFSDESSNAHILFIYLFFLEFSWTKPWDTPLISSPACKYIFVQQLSSLHIKSLFISVVYTRLMLRQWFQIEALPS